MEDWDAECGDTGYSPAVNTTPSSVNATPSGWNDTTPNYNESRNGFGSGRGQSNFGQSGRARRGGGRGFSQNSSFSGSRNSSDFKSNSTSNSSDWRNRNASPEKKFNGYGGGGSGDDDALFMDVSKRDIGRIIGKGGSKIRELEEQSEAKLKVLSDNDGDVAQVKITGSDSQKAKAKELIEDTISGSGFSGGGRGGGYSRGRGRGDNRSFSNNRSFNNAPPSRNNYSDDEDSDTERPPAVQYPANHVPGEGIAGFNWGNLLAAKERNEEEKFRNLGPIKKDFYFEDPGVANMYPEEVEEIRRENNKIKCVNMSKDGNTRVPNPIRTFEEAFNPYPEILDQIYNQNFVKPSPIQVQAWPVLLQGLDLIGIAQTGTGKTLAFLLPALIHIDSQPVPRIEREGPSCLVLSPTRELALQIEKEVGKIAYRGIKCVCIYGGGDRRKQIECLGTGVEIVVATPGRLNDLISNDIVSVKSVTYLILDEADRMLDMGFEPQIKKILLDIRPDRQTVMTSATWPPDVRRLGESYLRNPIQVFVGSLDLAAVHSITQHIEIVADEEKMDRLLFFIDNELQPHDKVLIFVGKKIFADHLSSEFSLREIPCQCIHGDREQYDREQALEDFTNSSVRILIATDVASRGLDVKDITHVFNYDFPRNIEEYVHRVGRTGRAGRTGVAISLFTRGDWRSAQELIDILVEANQHVSDELADMADRFKAWKARKEAEGGFRPRRGGGGRGGGGRGGGGRGRRDNFFCG